jgi:hypothetical protein
MIPAPNAIGELPPGMHTATLEEVEAGSGLTFLDFFQRNREDEPKGIVQLELEEIS